jgi:hypothetical protein
MKTNRLSLLAVAMLLVAVLRFAFPARETEIVTVEPTVRAPGSTVAVPVPRPDDQAEPATSQDPEVPGNAFAVRVLAPPPAPVATPAPVLPPVAVVPQTAPVPVAPPPPPPPPFEVIGTWADGGASAVFLATPSGTLIARPGSVLLAEYRVTGITAQHVTLTQESTQKTIQIPVPGSAAR